MMQARERAPARILKSRELAGTAVAAEPLAPVAAAPAAAAPRCGEKSARLVASEGGSAAVEVRCSCGEVTRVELSLEPAAAPEVQR